MKHKKLYSIGLDGITCSVRGKLVECETKYPPNSEHPLIHIKPKGNNTEIAIILPRFIRETNKQGFGIKDSIYLDDVIQNTNRFLKQSFYRDLTDLCVTSVEVAITVDLQIANEKLVNNLVELLSKVLLEEDTKHPTIENKVKSRPQNKWVVGKTRTGCVYIKDEITRSFITSTLTNKRLKWKCYSKGAETSFGGKTSIWRLEAVYNERGIKHALRKQKSNDIRLTDVLTPIAITQFVKQVKIDYQQTVNSKVNGYLNETHKIVYESLQTSKKPYDVLIRHKDLIFDFRQFSKALKKHYRVLGKSDASYRKMLSRCRTQISNEQNIFVTDGVIAILKEISRLSRS